MPVLQRWMSPKAYVQALAWMQREVAPLHRIEAYLLQLTQEVARTRAAFTEETLDLNDFDLTPHFDPDVKVDGVMTDDEMMNAAMRIAGVG